MTVGLVNIILTGFDENKCTVMVFLDLSAAFDTINKLLTKLDDEIGLRGRWVVSYSKNTARENEWTILRGSGSVLGPQFFNTYVRSQLKVFLKCGFETSYFADEHFNSMFCKLMWLIVWKISSTGWIFNAQNSIQIKRK